MTNAAWWEEDLALSINSYQADHRAGAEACERLLSRPGLPPHIEDCVRLNQTWYLEPLAARQSGVFVEPPWTRAVEITLGVSNLVPEGWSLFNPSIAKNPAGDMTAIVRSANYHIEPSGRYNIHDADGIIRTRNYIGGVSPTLGFGDWRLVDTSEVDAGKTDFLVQGFEDCRLYWDGHDWAFIATVRDRHPDGVCRIAQVDLEISTAVGMDLLSDGRRHEKNWMPFINDVVCTGYVYSCEPTLFLFAVDPGRGYYHQAPVVARSFRGGTQVIDYDHRSWLAIVHESVDFPPGTIPRRVYQHRFVHLTDHHHQTIELNRISPPFCFHGRGIEFAAGMVRDGDDLIISYGTNDERAWLLRVPLEQALGMLKEPIHEDL